MQCDACHGEGYTPFTPDRERVAAAGLHASETFMYGHSFSSDREYLEARGNAIADAVLAELGRQATEGGA